MSRSLMRKSYPALPNEIFRPIVAHLKDDKVSLCAISLSSSALCQEGQRIIFKDVSLRTSVYESADIETHRNFMNAFIASPTRLALFVKAYTHAQNNQNLGDSDEDETYSQEVERTENERKRNDDILKSTSAGLQTMRNLKSFKFDLEEH